MQKNEDKHSGADAAAVEGAGSSAPEVAIACHTDDARLYPCADCGVLRSKAEGGTTFTVCDDCWDQHYAALGEAKGRQSRAPRRRRRGR